MNFNSNKSVIALFAYLSGFVMPRQIDSKSPRKFSTSRSNGVFDLSRITNNNTVFFSGENTFKFTSNIVLNNGFPLACSRPISLHHIFTNSTSALAIAKSAVCFSNAVSSSPRSRPSVPSRSITSVGVVSHVSARDNHTPCVVCDRPRLSSISRNAVPNAWFSSVDFPELCGPMMATI